MKTNNLRVRLALTFALAGGPAYAQEAFDLRDIDGKNGFTLSGSDAFDTSGLAVSGAGDINGDGFADIIIGAEGGDPNGNGSAGETYVVFGRDTGFPAGINLADLNGTDGFVLNGIDQTDLSGGP